MKRSFLSAALKPTDPLKGADTLNIENYRIPNLNDPRRIAARVTAVHRDRFEIMTEFGPFLLKWV